MKSILVIFHCESNTGYAIGRLEKTFFTMAMKLTGDDYSRIHFGYPSMRLGYPENLPTDFRQYVLVDTCSKDPKVGAALEDYIRENSIDTVFGFDQGVTSPVYKYLRRGGVKTFFAYWGAPVSSIFGPIKLLLKKVDVALRGRAGPDHYIFESQGMAATAIYGRGIPRRKVHVVYLGTDTKQFRPDPTDADYTYNAFGIARHKKIFFFSGHMEPRKGVHVIMRAADRLTAIRTENDWHIVLLGNRTGDQERLLAELSRPQTAENISFGGYRTDIERLHHGCYAGIIASTGWDSLTMSSMEMQASGLPLIISDLAGLNEAIEDKATGFLFRAGDAAALSERMIFLLDNEAIRNHLSKNARNRVESFFTQERQIQELTDLVKKLV